MKKNKATSKISTKRNDDKNTGTKRSGLDNPPGPVLSQKAEEYLREQANIEDLPDEKDESDYDKKIKNS